MTVLINTLGTSIANTYTTSGFFDCTESWIALKIALLIICVTGSDWSKHSEHMAYKMMKQEWPNFQCNPTFSAIGVPVVPEMATCVEREGPRCAPERQLLPSGRDLQTPDRCSRSGSRIWARGWRKQLSRKHRWPCDAGLYGKASSFTLIRKS